ncbi:hypothetical protein Pmani_026110 [Petrolisthes manimaculis]|uniref:Uncharacterized protein n=1 Tax=Petrolisthes manimaculis TaxID=1843537 RepID=A0AAE1TWY9_9EUCA|nr:hypothetical protein Pmani_026110 [Petrolisthes manimaculis]
MFTQTAVLVVLAGLAVAAPADLYNGPGPQSQGSYSPPPTPGYSAPRQGGYNQDQRIPYDFQYGVKDEYAGTDFSQNEESDGEHHVRSLPLPPTIKVDHSKITASFPSSLSPNMFTQTAVLVVLAGLAVAAPADLYNGPGPQSQGSYSPPPTPGYSAPRQGGYNQDQRIPYDFQYGVKDEYAGTDFSQNEESDGEPLIRSSSLVIKCLSKPPPLVSGFGQFTPVTPTKVINPIFKWFPCNTSPYVHR